MEIWDNQYMVREIKGPGCEIICNHKRSRASRVSILMYTGGKISELRQKLIQLDSGESYEFQWSRNKKRRTAEVGFLVKVDRNITFKDADVNKPRIMAMNLMVYRFNIGVVV